MLNQVVLVGRIVKRNETKTNGKKIIKFTIGVPRPFKNINGDYEKDFIEIILWNGLSEISNNYCQKGDLVGIKGRLQSNVSKDTKNNNKLEVIAEKVTIISGNKTN